MERIYEAEEETEDGKKFKKVDKSKATHVHKCRHDEGKPCSRIS